MTFDPVTTENIHIAAQIHSASWKESHKSFCSEAFIIAHTPEQQRRHIEQAIECGSRFFILTDGGPKGIVSINGRLIENLYVLLLSSARAMDQDCCSTPSANAKELQPCGF